MERVLQARRGQAAGPGSRGDPRSHQADDNGEREREHRLQRDAGPARHERRDENDRRPQCEQCDQERPDGPEPIRERLEEGEQRALERPGGLRRDDAREREQTRSDRDDVRRPSHANLAGWRSIEPAAHWERAFHRRLFYRDFPAASSLDAGEAPRAANRQMSGRTTRDTWLILSARSSSNSLATAWIVAAIGIASSAPTKPSIAPPQSTATRTVSDGICTVRP